MAYLIRPMQTSSVRAINRALHATDKRLDLYFDGERQQHVVTLRLAAGPRPFVYFRTAGPLSVGGVVDAVRRNLWKMRNGQVTPVKAHEDDKGAALAAYQDQTHDARMAQLWPHREEIERDMRDRTDGRGPNGGGKFYGPIMDRRSVP